MRARTHTRKKTQGSFGGIVRRVVVHLPLRWRTRRTRRTTRMPQTRGQSRHPHPAPPPVNEEKRTMQDVRIYTIKEKVRGDTQIRKVSPLTLLLPPYPTPRSLSEFSPPSISASSSSYESYSYSSSESDIALSPEEISDGVGLRLRRRCARPKNEKSKRTGEKPS